MDLINEMYESSDTDESDVVELISATGSREPIIAVSQASECEKKPTFSLSHSIADFPVKTSVNPQDSSDSESDSSSEFSDTESVRTSFSSVSSASKRPESPYEGFASKPVELVSSSLEDLKLSPNAQLAKAGIVRSILDNILVVESLPGTSTLHLESVLFLDKEKVLGRVFDVFGPVIRPLYSVRFESADQVSSLNISIGTEVFIVPSDLRLTAYVFENELRKEKGTDASWEDNDEIPPEEEEFSDDEKEKEARQRRERNKRMLDEAGKKACWIPNNRDVSMKEKKPRHRKKKTGLPNSSHERFRPMMPPPPYMQPPPQHFPPNPFAVRYQSFQMFPSMRFPPNPPLTMRCAPSFSRMNLPRPTSIARPDLADSVASLICAVSPKTVSDVPAVSVNRPSSVFNLPVQITPAAKEVIGTMQLITDPKKLPSASSLFYDPRNDPTLMNQPKNLFRF